MTPKKINIPDDLWTATKAQALLEGIAAQDVVMQALVDYLDRAAKPPEYVVNTEHGITTVHYDLPPIDPDTAPQTNDALRPPPTTPSPLPPRIYDPHFGFARPAPKPVKRSR